MYVSLLHEALGQYQSDNCLPENEILLLSVTFGTHECRMCRRVVRNSFIFSSVV
jgi:hypothetical protein